MCVKQKAPEVFLRPVRMSDGMWLWFEKNAEWNWRWDREGKKVGLIEHWDWLKKTLRDLNKRFWAVEIGCKFCGRMLRAGAVRIEKFSKAAEMAEISVYILPAFQGRGIGQEAIKKACTQAFGAWDGLCVIRATVQMENAASLRAFHGAGFVHGGICDMTDGFVEMELWRTKKQPST